MYNDDQGVWNWIKDDDRTKATNAFIQDARKYANQADFVENTKAQTEERLRELLKTYASEVVIEFGTTLPDKR
jgi:hypothetical protein